LKQCRQIRDGATEEVKIEHLLIRVQQGEGEEAAGPLFALVEANHPQSGYILYTIARVYMVQMRYRYALASLSMWAEVDPTNPLIYPLRGAVLERLEEPRAALADYEKAVELSPEAFPPRLRLAEMLIEDKKTPDAIKHLELLMTTHPHRPEVRARLGMCRYYQGRKEEARRLMESALPEMPNDPVLLVALARLDIQDHDGVAAEKRLKDLIAKDHAEEEGRFLLVTALRLQGRDADADVAQRDSERVRGLNERLTKLLRDQVDTANAGPDVWCEIGGVLLQLGLDKRAFAWFDRALDRDPNHQPTHRVLIGYYEKKGEADNADKHRRYLR
jgi:tetratricopeptide (TPR) repeat protein